MIKKAKKIIICYALIFSFLIIPLKVFSGPVVPQGSKYDSGNYELSDVMQMGVNVANIILGLVGSLALLMFVYGGVMMLISSGNSEKVSKAKGIIIAAVIGLAIVFSSYLIISFVMESFGVNWSGGVSH
jgi:hypothetical protein